MRLLFCLAIVCSGITSFAQQSDSTLSLILADAMRQANVPGAACAVITSDTIQFGVSGVVAVDSDTPIHPNSHFHLGSCTKSITGFIAARSVKDGTIHWDTKFLDLFPGLKLSSREDYANVTLMDLLSHQAWLPAYTSERAFRKLPAYSADDQEARLKFAKVVLAQKPVKHKTSYEYSNAGYVLAALMVEKAIGMTWEDQVSSYFREQGWDYQLGYASYADEAQPAGHYLAKGKRKRIAKGQDFDVPSFLAPAGDVSMRVVDYAAYLQQQLIGLQRGDTYLNKEEYQHLHFSNEVYAIGWGHGTMRKGSMELSTHTGSAGAFLAMMVVVPSKDLAVLVVTNAGDDTKTNDAVKSVRNRLLRENL